MWRLANVHCPSREAGGQADSAKRHVRPSPHAALPPSKLTTSSVRPRPSVERGCLAKCCHALRTHTHTHQLSEPTCAQGDRAGAGGHAEETSVYSVRTVERIIGHSLHTVAAQGGWVEGGMGMGRAGSQPGRRAGPIVHPDTLLGRFEA